MTTRVITRTVFSSALQTALYRKQVHEVLPYSSILESLTDPLVIPFQPDVLTRGMEVTDPYVPATDTTSMETAYLVIGNGGHRAIIPEGGGVPVNTPIPHKPSDAGLYNWIPFAVVPADNDYSALERETRGYRIRKTLLIDGILHVAYYGKRLPAGTSIDMVLTTIVDGNAVHSAFTPTINNLRPPTPDIGAASSGNMLSVTAPTELALDATDIQRLQDACLLLFGNADYAILSELTVCHGVEKEVTGRYPNTGTQTLASVAAATYYEVVGAQAAVHITTKGYTDAGAYLTMDFGHSEPLFGVNV